VRPGAEGHIVRGPVLHRVTLERVEFPPDTEFVLGIGRHRHDEVCVLVPAKDVLRVLADVHAGRHPVVSVHDFDVLDWTPWDEDLAPGSEGST
jgi:hypothetical protein